MPEAEAEAEDALLALADLAALRAAEASVEAAEVMVEVTVGAPRLPLRAALACEERGKQRTAHEDKKAWKYVQTHV